jgi:hypothetical protein
MKKKDANMKKPVAKTESLPVPSPPTIIKSSELLTKIWRQQVQRSYAEMSSARSDVARTAAQNRMIKASRELRLLDGAGITRAKIVRHEEFQKLIAEVLGVIVRFPDAHAAVTAWLDQLED